MSGSESEFGHQYAEQPEENQRGQDHEGEKHGSWQALSLGGYMSRADDVLKAMSAGRIYTTTEIQKKLKMGDSVCRRSLNKLFEGGLIEKLDLNRLGKHCRITRGWRKP